MSLSKWLLSVVCISSVMSAGCQKEMLKKKDIYSKILPERKILEICGGHDGPVIKQGDPGTEGNKYGFEGGRAFKYKGDYHIFTAERVGDPIIVKMKMAHWKSPDGIKWQRISTLYESSGNFTGEDPRAALWAPMPYYNEKEGRWNLFYTAYRCKPNDPTGWYENYEGKIWRAVSTVPGYDGLDGPYEDVGIALQPSPDSGPWEGLQGTDSFYAYQVGDRWYALFGSAQTQTDLDPDYPKWAVGFATAPELAGPWKRLNHMNPIKFHPVFAENPIIVKLADGRYSATLDGGSHTQFGYSFSDDGMRWSKASFVDIALEFDQWWTVMRTPLGLIPEPDGTYTVFYTAYTETDFAEIGMVKFKEGPDQSSRLYLNELDIQKVMQAWGDPQRNKSITEKTMDIAGRTFKRGIGSHAESRIYIDTKNSVKRFVSYVGVDVGVDSGQGTVEFFVIGDGKVLWKSGVMKNGDPEKKVDVDTTGVKMLLLYASDAGDGNGSDHADWADAYFVVDGDDPVIAWPDVRGL
jgi:hypothetical protein